jgi:hypothetical protein
MYNSDTDLIFPTRVIPTLRSLRGEPWQKLIDQIQNLEPTDIDRLAFSLLMIKLGGCTSCQADSFRALRGCTSCAHQTIRRYRGSDADLLDLFASARKDIERYMGR